MEKRLNEGRKREKGYEIKEGRERESKRRGEREERRHTGWEIKERRETEREAARQTDGQKAKQGRGRGWISGCFVGVGGD